jgi:RND family efflux transporter MFP subunit
MRPALLLLPLICAACGATPDKDRTPEAAVTTVAPRQGSATRWLTAYGSAMPAANGTETLSVNQPGQITRYYVTQGASVRAGQPIVAFATAPAALSGYEAAVTTLATARRQRDTTARLLTQQLATTDQLAQAEKAVADAKAALAAQQRDGAGTAARTLRAGFDGVVTAIPAAPGDRVQPGAPLATIARNGAMIVTAGIDPGERATIAVGRPARLTRLGGGPMITARILRIDGQLNPVTHLVDVDIAFPAGVLMPGEPIRAELAAGEATGWIVPHQAIATDGASPHVFQLANGKARAVPVAIVQANARQDVVTGPLAPSEPLIVDGAYQVSDGDSVHTVHA